MIAQIVQLSQRRLDLARQHCAGELEQLALRRQAEHGKHVGLLDAVAAETDELVEGGFGVTHGTGGAAGDRGERRRLHVYFLLTGDVGQVLDDKRGGDTPQVEALAAREDGRQDFFRFGRCEHELHVLRRFFQRFEQRVKVRRREHVNFVNDVDLEFGRGRSVFARLAQFTHLLDAVISGAVNLEDIQRAALGYFLAARVFIVEIDLGPAGAVQTFGKNAGDGGLAGAARAAEEVRMGDSLLLNGMGQRLCDMLLADDVAETLRTVFAGYDLISHL